MIKPYFHHEHYSYYTEVSKSHGWPPLPMEFLSPFGFVSYIDEKPAAIVFVYQTIGCNWGVMEWLFVSKDIPKDKRNEAITEVVEAAKGYANSHKLTLFTTCKGAKLMSRYIQAGFQKTDTSMTNFIYWGK